MRKMMTLMMSFIMSISLAACGNAGISSASLSETELPEEVESAENIQVAEQKESTTNRKNELALSEQEKQKTAEMKIQIGDIAFTVTLEDNASADALKELMADDPLIINMSDYSGFEKVGALGKSLPADDSQITTGAGDIVLYQGNQIVIFYGSNSWSYTKLGRINDLTGFEEALGNGDVTVTFSLED